MADLATTSSTEITESSTGLITRFGELITQFRKISQEPAFRRSMPTIVAVLVTLIGLVAYFVMQQPVYTTLYASLPEAEKSRVVDALENAGVSVSLDPTTGDVMVSADDYPLHV